MQWKIGQHWIVINKDTGKWIDKEYSKEQAIKNAEIMTKHNIKYGHKANYVVQYKTSEEIEKYRQLNTFSG